MRMARCSSLAALIMKLPPYSPKPSVSTPMPAIISPFPTLTEMVSVVDLDLVIMKLWMALIIHCLQVMANLDFLNPMIFCATFMCMLGAEVAISPESGEGEMDASLMITTEDGVGPFLFSIDGGTTFQESNLFDNLPAGDYDIVVTGSFDCLFETSITVPLCQMLIMAEVQNVTEDGASNGSIEITGSNGTPPYSYSIDGGQSFQASKVFNNLPVGSYNLLVQDAIGCSAATDTIIDLQVGLDDFILGYAMEVFPNPGDGLYRINVSGIQLGDPYLDFLVYDADGKMIQSGNLVSL